MNVRLGHIANRLRRLRAVALCFVLLLPLGSCVLSHQVGMDGEMVQLRCRPRLCISTRSADHTSATQVGKLFPIDTDFALWALSLDRGQRWDDNSYKARMYVRKERFAANSADSVWYPASRIAWDYDRSLTVAACSPSHTNAQWDSERGIVIDLYDTTQNPSTDLMYTPLHTDMLCDEHPEGVDLTFEHALCKVDVRCFSSMQQSQYIDIKRVEFEGVYYRGEFSSLPEPKWVPTSDIVSVVLFDSEQEPWRLPDNNDGLLTNSDKMLLPQTITTRIKVVADVCVGGMITQDQEFITRDINVAWQAGKYYTYSLDFVGNKVNVTEPRPEEIE